MENLFNKGPLGERKGELEDLNRTSVELQEFLLPMLSALKTEIESYFTEIKKLREIEENNENESQVSGQDLQAMFEFWYKKLDEAYTRKEEMKTLIMKASLIGGAASEEIQKIEKEIDELKKDLDQRQN
jgi:hypothetical protein